MLKARASGILLHITSLPSLFGIGDLGPQSYHFADLLAKANQHYWSILPLNPTRLEDGNSPYQTSSAYAGNALLISPERLIESGFLPKEYLLNKVRAMSAVDFEAVYTQKYAMLAKAYLYFKQTKLLADDFESFCGENEAWLNNYALYSALRSETNKPWFLWPVSLRKRESHALLRKQETLREEIEREKFAQYLFFSQWQDLKEYCREKKIRIIGDMPFYAAYDSVDMWVNPEYFSLTATGKPQFVGGVPPDYFSATGQLWGNPVYNWKKLAQTGFDWWINRIRHNLTLYDELRLDHFRGFVAYWQVSASAKTAKTGRWVKVPSDAFFTVVKAFFPSLPFIAEDLGYIDEPVRQAIKELDIPGMKVLLFAFDDARDNPHLPQNHTHNSAVYTGTHDTNTVRGWFIEEASVKGKRNLHRLLDKKVTSRNVSSELVEMALDSVANFCILPLQDVLGLGSEARMNNPGRTNGNWVWRVTSKQLESENFLLLADQTRKSGRV